MISFYYFINIIYLILYYVKVSISDLGLSKEEQIIFIEMIGKRYNTGKREVNLTCDRFPNRIENKRYLTLLLENLILESKKLYKLSPTLISQ